MEPEASQGQAGTADQQATAAAADAQAGQSTEPAPTTGNGSVSGDTFFDPKSIEGKPELEQAYKQMQGDYTKAKQGLKAQQQKLDAYDNFMANPEASVRQLAEQYGYSLVKGQPDNSESESWQPKTWDDVMERAKELVRAEFEPVLDEVQTLKKDSVEARLDKDFPDWRTYEDAMVANLGRHPSLANDHEALYELSIPKELRDQRAMQAAMKKLKGETESATVSDNKSTSVPTSDEPPKGISFEQAVEYARKKVAAQGLAPVPE